MHCDCFKVKKKKLHSISFSDNFSSRKANEKAFKKCGCVDHSDEKEGKGCVVQRA